jgi:hypothetical protein
LSSIALALIRVSSSAAAATAAGIDDLFVDDFRDSALHGTDDDFSYTKLFNDEHISSEV